VARCEQQGEASAHAKADHADLSSAARFCRKPRAHCFDVVERSTATRADALHDVPNAGQHRSPVIKVRCRRQEALAGEPIGLAAEIVARAAGVVKDDDAWEGALAGWNGKIDRQRAASARDVGVRQWFNRPSR